jgi:hypothetical protein
MRTRRRNWFLRRLTLALAVAAIAVPTAQARIDEGIKGQPNSAQEIASQDVTRTFTDGRSRVAESNVVQTGQYMPHAGLNEYLQSRDGIEVVRAQPSSVGHMDIEIVRAQPRGIGGPTVVASPGFNWGDAGLGAGLMLAALLVIGGSALAARQLAKPQTA